MLIRVLSRSNIERLLEKGLPNNTAIVSFSDTEDDFIEFPAGTDVLQIAFYDVRPHTVVKEHYGKILPEAKQIAEYVYQKKLEGKDLICQCDYGISRSAGLAAAVLQRWGKKGIEVFADYRYTPNQFVYNKVLKELEQLGNKEEKP